MKRRSFLKLAGVATAVSSSLTCAPVFASSAKMKPGMTTFMPDNGQIHGVGKPSKSINIDYIKTWTVSWRKKAGSLIKTTPTQLPSGKYLTTLQLWHQTSAGKYLGELRCWKDGQQIAAKAI